MLIKRKEMFIVAQLKPVLGGAFELGSVVHRDPNLEGAEKAALARADRNQKPYAVFRNTSEPLSVAQPPEVPKAALSSVSIVT